MGQGLDAGSDAFPPKSSGTARSGIDEAMEPHRKNT